MTQPDNRQVLLYIYPAGSSFVTKDITMLRDRFTVLTPGHTWENKRLLPLTALMQLCFLITRGQKAAGIFVMFGGYWSLLPALYGKLRGIPVWIIPGGTECVSFPDLNYGSLRKPLQKRVIGWSFRLATRLLPVDESLVESEYRFYRPELYQRQGIRHFFPDLKTPVTVIHNGFDPGQFNPGDTPKQPGTVITVAGAASPMRVKLKGLDYLTEAARLLPELSFTLVGVERHLLAGFEPIPANVRIYGHLTREEFSVLLYRSEVVVQPSLSEGFPNALCEGMLARCFPVCSPVGGMPGIIGETGFLIQTPDAGNLASVLKKVFSLPPGQLALKQEEARDRIRSLFPVSRRKDAFEQVILEDTTG
ncbi:MAG: glycosyltransferase family 4 protein [Bacteroidetes bacterium]|nr:glycosyltransferase family 4 protein [Bacteroidota bacterium]